MDSSEPNEMPPLRAGAPGEVRAHVKVTINQPPQSGSDSAKKKNQTTISHIYELTHHVRARIHQNKSPIWHANEAKRLRERQQEEIHTLPTNTSHLRPDLSHSSSYPSQPLAPFITVGFTGRISTCCLCLQLFPDT